MLSRAVGADPMREHILSSAALSTKEYSGIGFSATPSEFQKATVRRTSRLEQCIDVRPGEPLLELDDAMLESATFEHALDG
jgi:hypothetical protein